MKVVIREAAYTDLERIFAWIAKDNPAAARAVVDRIFDAIDRLAEFPRMGRSGSVTGTHEWVVHGLPYIIVYTFDEQQDELAVIAIFHGAQDR